MLAGGSVRLRCALELCQINQYIDTNYCSSQFTFASKSAQHRVSPHLDSLADILHPLGFLSQGSCGHHQSPLAVVDVEAEVGAHPGLAVHHLEVCHSQLAVYLELNPLLGGAIGVEQHVGELGQRRDQ